MLLSFYYLLLLSVGFHSSIVSAYNLARKMATNPTPPPAPAAPQWDAVNGVWVGDAALTTVATNDLPSPLYIVGYGSLLFRPGDLLSPLPSFAVQVNAHKRRFAQRSSDHRGRPAFPGLVVTLVSSVEEADDEDEPDCHGRVWQVPEDAEFRSKLLAYLDHRERGGYSRTLVEVTMLEDSKFHSKGSSATALVYTGLPSNPHYHLLPLERAANVIASAHGPSGANADYLLHLESYLSSQRIIDAYMRNLRARVERRLSFHRLRPRLAVQSESVSDRGTDAYSVNLLGWGSDEHGQLGLPPAAPSVAAAAAAAAAVTPAPSASPADCHSTPSALTSVLDRIAAYLSLSPGELAQLLGEGLQRGTTRVVAGGACSGLLLRLPDCSAAEGSKLFVWGRVPSCIADLLTSNAAVDISGDSGGAGSISMFPGVVDASFGHDSLLLLLSDGRVWQIDDHQRSSADLQSPLPPFVVRRPNDALDAAQGKEATEVFKVSAGPTHNAAITSLGLFTWGPGAFEGLQGWSPTHDLSHDTPTTIKLIDVCCAMKHTVVVDELGDVWAVGKNKYLTAAAGSSSSALSQDQQTPQKVEVSFPSQGQGQGEGEAASGDAHSQPIPIKWHKLSCGWHHVLLSGVCVDGSVSHCAWGRSDMQQYPRSLSLGPQDSNRSAVLLPSAGSPVHTVWAGAEHSLMIDDLGRVWASGWNEHGNLGNGTFEGSDKVGGGGVWQPVLSPSGQQLISLQSETREAVAACGGAHCLLVQLLE